jgi:hypothetical protein
MLTRWSPTLSSYMQPCLQVPQDVDIGRELRAVGPPGIGHKQIIDVVDQIVVVDASWMLVGE